MRVHGLASADVARVRARRLLGSVGIPETAAGETPDNFSGGQRQRIAIARALAAQPSIILCDEPVTALDISVRGHVMNVLRDIQERENMAFLFVSHDLALVRKFCSRIYVMAGGRIVDSGPSEQMWHDPQSQETRDLLRAVPKLSRR
jgi:peptide/nickel transport system ATP-binding protein